MTTRQERAATIYWTEMQEYAAELRAKSTDEHYHKKVRRALNTIADELLRLQGKAEYQVDRELDDSDKAAWHAITGL